MVRGLFAAVAPLGCLAPWDPRQRNPAGWREVLSPEAAGGWVVVANSGLTDQQRRFCQVVAP
jgi:hypothetical protein